MDESKPVIYSQLITLWWEYTNTCIWCYQLNCEVSFSCISSFYYCSTKGQDGWHGSSDQCCPPPCVMSYYQRKQIWYHEKVKFSCDQWGLTWTRYSRGINIILHITIIGFSSNNFSAKSKHTHTSSLCTASWMWQGMIPSCCPWKRCRPAWGPALRIWRSCRRGTAARPWSSSTSTSWPCRCLLPSHDRPS